MFFIPREQGWVRVTAHLYRIQIVEHELQPIHHISAPELYLVEENGAVIPSRIEERLEITKEFHLFIPLIFQKLMKQQWIFLLNGNQHAN